MFSLQSIQNGALIGRKVMPQKDSTSDGQSSFEMGRRVYNQTRSEIVSKETVSNIANKKWLGGNNRDASQIVANRRAHSIGQGSVGASGKLMSFTTYKDVNVVDNALRRTRAGGYMVPPKVRG